MANDVRVRATVDDKVSGPLDRIKDKVTVLGKSGAGASFLGNLGAMGVAKGLSLVEQGLGAVVDQAFVAVEAASNLREAMALNEQVFGANSKAMEAWAANASDSFGESQRSALTYAANFGNVLKSSGLAMDDVSAKSRELTERAADLGSAFNQSGEDVATALRAGLVGEAEPLRRFGVLLSAAAVEAEAYASGIAKVGKPLTEAQKVQARYNIILRQTADSAGMFGRDTDSLADAQKALSAAVEDTQAKFGKALLPVMLELANVAKDDLIPALEALTDGMDMTQFGQDAGGAVRFLADSVGILAKTTELATLPLRTVIDGWGLFADVVRNATEALTPWDEAAQRAAESQAVLASHMADATKDDAYAARVQELAGELPSALDEAKTEAVEIAAATPGEIADALRGNRDEWQGALDQLKTDMETRMSRMTEIAKIKGALASTELAAGLKSKDNVVRAQAEATKKILETALARLGYVWGQNLALLYAGGILSKTDAVANAARIMSKIPADYLQQKSPAKEGPLSEGGGSEGWGKKGAELFAKGWEAGMPRMGSALSQFAGGISSPAVARPAAPTTGIGPLELHVHMHTDGGVLTPAQGQAIAREVGPFLMDYISRRG
jgi:hypothetical protein